MESKGHPPTGLISAEHILLMRRFFQIKVVNHRKSKWKIPLVRYFCSPSHLCLANDICKCRKRVAVRWSSRWSRKIIKNTIVCFTTWSPVMQIATFWLHTRYFDLDHGPLLHNASVYYAIRQTRLASPLNEVLRWAHFDSLCFDGLFDSRGSPLSYESSCSLSWLWVSMLLECL